MGRDDILITLVHYGRAPEDWQLRHIALPLAIERANFASFEGITRPVATDSFILDDQAFQLWVVFGVETPSDELLVEANRVLAAVALEARTLALGSLSMRRTTQPDRFHARRGERRARDARCQRDPVTAASWLSLVR